MQSLQIPDDATKCVLHAKFPHILHVFVAGDEHTRQRPGRTMDSSMAGDLLFFSPRPISQDTVLRRNSSNVVTLSAKALCL